MAEDEIEIMAVEHKEPKDFTIRGLVYLQIAKYQVDINNNNIVDIIRKAAGCDTDYRGDMADILIQVKFARTYLNVTSPDEDPSNEA